MSCRAVSFDLDATLLDNSFIPDTIAACCRFVAERLGIDPSMVASANAAEFGAYWPRVETELALGSTTGEQMIREVWSRALAACACGDTQLLDDLIVEHVRLDAVNARLFDDVLPVIEELRGAGIRLALITNGPSDTQRARLASLGIDEYFDAVVISGEVGAVKPDSSLFAIVAQALDVAGLSLWHVGDNLATDVAGAIKAGHTAVWLNRHGGIRTPTDPMPHFEVTSLREMLTLVS